MAKTVSQSKVLNSLKAKAKGAWDDSRNVVAKPKGIVQLPSGIKGGVARITHAELTESEPNEQGTYPVVLLKFIVREPVDYEGTQQNKYYNFYDRKSGKGKGTPKSIKDVLNELSSDIQLLGVETAGTDIDDIPKLLDSLNSDKPYFLFDTWKPPQNADGSDSRTQVFIQGLATEYEPPADEPGVASEGEASPEPEPEPVAEPEKPKGPKPKGPGAKRIVSVPAPEPEPEPEPEPQPEAEDEPIAGEENAEPVVGDQFYCVLGGEKVVVEVTAVDADKKTVAAKIIATGKVWKPIAWSKLTGE